MHRQMLLRSLSPTENVISSILKSRVGLRAAQLWCNENCPLYYRSGLSFYMAGIQDVSTRKDIDAAMQLWRACVNETIKENKDFAWVAYCGEPGRKMDPHPQYIEISILFATLQARKYGKRWTSSELQGAETLPAQTQLFDRSADRESCRNSHESLARLILICEISFFRWQKEIDVANSWRVPD
jgi:hypothetical protein